METSLLELPTTLLLAGHLLTMNIAAAGPLLAVWLAWRAPAGDRARAVLGGRLGRWSVGGLLLGAASGGTLACLPNDGLRAALRRLPADAYVFAGLELLFSLACMLGVAALCSRQARPKLALALALATSTNLLYHFPPLMAVIGKLAADASWAAGDEIHRRALLSLWARPEVLALWAHFVLASFATAAIAAQWPIQRSPGEVEEGPAVQRLAAIALGASLAQVPVGVWLLATTHGEARNALLGGDLLASACFAAGVLAAMGLLQTLAAMSLGDVTASQRRRAGGLLILVAGLMSATLRLSRDAETPAAAHAMQGAPVVDYLASPSPSGSFSTSSKAPPGSLPLAISSP